MPHPVHAQFVLAGDPTWQVRDLVVREALSHPYTVDVVLERVLDLPLPLGDVEKQLGQDCTLTIEADFGVRLIHGKLLQLRKVANSSEQVYIHARIVPALRLAEHTRHSRVYAEQSRKDAVEKLLASHLGQHSRKHSWKLSRDYPAREMIVQYAESDLDFIHRQLEAAGITYHFTPQPSQLNKSEELTLDDDGASFHPVPVFAIFPTNAMGVPRLHFIEHDAILEGLLEFESASTLTVTAVNRHVFDWETSNLEPLESKVEAQAGLSVRQDDAVRGEVLDAAGSGPVQTEAELELRRQRQERGTARGKSTVPGFAPGRLFAVQDFGTFLITSVVHRGQTSTDSLSEAIDYVNEFECMRVDPKQTPPRRFVPRRRTPRPNMGGPHTALVVDSGGKDKMGDPIIHTDKKGRIKVRFHWERDEDDDSVFAWLRVAQTWAGPGYGFVFVPRVGMEVVVDFLGGDPDSPMVAGCVYDDRQVIAPDGDPVIDAETRSWIRTRSEDGQGFNELLFDDARGAELVHLRAQKDRVADILDNETISVGTNQSVSVGNDQSISVGHDQTVTIGPNRTTKIETSDTLTVGSTRSVSVGDTKTITVGDAIIKMDKTEGITIKFKSSVIQLSDGLISVKSDAVTVDGKQISQTAEGFFTAKGKPITLNPPG
jgi:type VI secretion system secreted protein VgrG